MPPTATTRKTGPKKKTISKEDLGTLLIEGLITQKMALDYVRVVIEERDIGSPELELLGITTEEHVARIHKEVESAMEQLRSGKSEA